MNREQYDGGYEVGWGVRTFEEGSRVLGLDLKPLLGRGLHDPTLVVQLPLHINF